MIVVVEQEQWSSEFHWQGSSLALGSTQATLPEMDAWY